MIELIIFDYFGVIYDRKTQATNEQLLKLALGLRADHKVALLSNSSKDTGNRLHLEFADKYFDLIATSSEIGFAKPSKEAYLNVSGCLFIDPKKCLMIDDSEINCQGARSVGMKAVLYQGYKSLLRDFERLGINS